MNLIHTFEDGREVWIHRGDVLERFPSGKWLIMGLSFYHKHNDFLIRVLEDLRIQAMGE